MSDPLAVYTQVGVGATNKGINLKVGQAYDTGIATTAGMNVMEVKGIYGDALGWESDSKTTDSMAIAKKEIGDITFERITALCASLTFAAFSQSTLLLLLSDRITTFAIFATFDDYCYFCNFCYLTQ